MQFIHNGQTGVLEYGELMFSKVDFVIFCQALALLLICCRYKSVVGWSY